MSRNALAILFGMLASTMLQAQQQAATTFAALCTAYNAVMGANSALIPFVAGCAIVMFFVILTLNEGNQMVSWALKILIGVSGLIGASAILGTLFPNIGPC